MNILILAVGRLREEPLARLCEDYALRIRRGGHQLTVEEVREEPGYREPADILSREAGRLRSRLPEETYAIALDSGGKEYDSVAFAGRLEALGRQGINKISFLVGGHLGLERRLIEQCKEAISLSRLTFPHQLARLILLEQLYRANTILRGEPYHK
jgi:23S rRNA (pseudouridine1915-N3)-methyltransferase